MGSVLRLDRRTPEIESQEAASASVVTRALVRVTRGWVGLLIADHRPARKLHKWGRVDLTAGEMDIEAGEGTKTYLELWPGIYEAETYVTGSESRTAAYVFRVLEDHSIEMLRRDDPAILPELLGVSIDDHQAAIERENQVLAALARATGLADLVEGSEKQIAFANSFRIAKVGDASAYLEERREKLREMRQDDPDRYQNLVAVEWLEEAFREMEAETSARWWIDQLQPKGHETLRALARQLRNAAIRQEARL